MPDRRGFLKVASAIGATTTAVDTFAAGSVSLNVKDATSNIPGPNVVIPQAPGLRSFSDDRIGGQAASDLLGKTHPQNFLQTKAALVESLKSSVSETDPIVSWVNTFSRTFDERTFVTISRAARALVKAEDEPSRVWWRLQLLREWSHEQEGNQVFPGSPRARSASGARAT